MALRTPEVNSDGEKVRYEEDDNSLPKGAPPSPARTQEENTINKPLNDLVNSNSSVSINK